MTDHTELLARLDSTSKLFENNQLAKDAAAAIRELEQQLEAEREEAEKHRREDVRKCEAIADRYSGCECAYEIRTAFPDCFQEKET